MKKRNRILPVIMAVLIFFNSFYCPMPSVNAAGGMTLQELQQKFPAGKYWNHVGSNINNPDGYTDTPCNHHGNCSYDGSCGCNSAGNSIQCFGFANKCAYDVYGSYYTSWNTTSLNDVKAGDVIRYENNGHSIFVTGVNGDTITFGDCNAGGHCIIRWNQTISKTTIARTLTAVYSAPYELPNENMNPIGVADYVEGREGAIWVRGWAFDNDNKTQALEIHVYIGGSAGSGAVGYAITANKGREDVGNQFPGVGNYHGFDEVINTDRRGLQEVYIYAINIGTGSHTILWQGTVNISNAYNPQGDVDIVEGQDGKIYVAGWAFDRDDVNQALDIHVYIGQDCYILKANQGRTDVDDAFPGVGDFHGFSGTIETDQVGEKDVKIYAINVGPGSNVLLEGKSYTAYVKPIGTNRIPDGTYVLRSSLNENLVFDISGASSFDSDQLTIQQYDGGKNQKFNITYIGNNRYKIVVDYSGKNVCVEEGNFNNGAKIEQRSGKDEINQQWIFQESEDGYYYIYSAMNGRCIDVPSANAESGSTLQMYDYNGTAAQKWKLVSASEKVHIETVTNTAVGVRILWDESADMESYRIYRKTEGSNWILLSKNLTGTSYIDKKAIQGEKYYYAVRG